MDKKVLAIIPAKGTSSRLPGKNMRLLGGKPLLQHALDAARASRLIDAVCVSTDSPEIRSWCEAQDAWVPCLQPRDLARPEVPAHVPVLDLLEKLGGATAWSHCVLLLPTLPFRTARSLDAAIEVSLATGRNVVSVTPLAQGVLDLRTLSADGSMRRLSGVRLRGASVTAAGTPALYVVDGGIEVAPTRPLLWARTFQYGEPLAHVMDPTETFDIDTEDDLRRAEALLGTARGAVA